MKPLSAIDREVLGRTVNLFVGIHVCAAIAMLAGAWVTGSTDLWRVGVVITGSFPIACGGAWLAYHRGRDDLAVIATGVGIPITCVGIAWVLPQIALSMTAAVLAGMLCALRFTSGRRLQVITLACVLCMAALFGFDAVGARSAELTPKLALLAQSFVVVPALIAFAALMWFVYTQQRRINEQLQSTVEQLRATQAELVDSHRSREQELQQRVRERTTELEVARDEAEAAGRAKAEFLASMSHEIRTPMNAVIGFAELLAESRLDAKQHDYLRSIRSGGEHLLGIINDVLDLSKMRAQQFKLDHAPLAVCLLYTSPSPRDRSLSRMPSSA